MRIRCRGSATPAWTRANTNIIGLDGRTFAIVEAGARPVELTYELDTVAHVDFDGTLPNGFTAHPKRDPKTGELFAAAYFWGLDHIQYIVVGTDGRVRKLEPISVKGSPMMHDMSLTERHAVIYDLPVTFNLEVAAAGGRFPYTLGRRLRRARRRAAPRGHERRRPLVRGRAVLRVPSAQRVRRRRPRRARRHSPPPDVRPGPSAGRTKARPSLWRWTVDLSSGMVKEEQLSDRAEEFPRVDERVVSRPHRFGYGASLSVGDDVGFDGSLDAQARPGERHHRGP